MSIVIFGDLFSFPEGQAATNRVYTYAKGFIENGINVHVICFSNNYLDQKEGISDGINYYLPFAQKRRSNYFIVRTWQKLLKYRNALSIIKKINNTDKIIAINSWSNLLNTHLFGYLLSRITKSKFIVECSEHPLRFHQGSALRKKRGEFGFSVETAISDGIFCISNFLIDYYRSKGVDSHRLLLVPSTVDTGRFGTMGCKPVNYKYIGYFGSLTFARDNVDLLIKAFAEFSNRHDDIHLILGGFCTDDERKNLVDLIGDSNIEHRVLLLGYLSREEVLQYISHADILVMVRSNNLESQASYPSKLTEFLASSKPVIAVNVGEIPFYLKDGKDAFLVEPGNVKALVEKMNFVYNNPALAYRVGKNGRKLTETIFDYNHQAKRMVDFIHSLKIKSTHGLST